MSTSLKTVDDYISRKLVHEIHTSELRSYRACRRRWAWIFRENYYPIMTAKPLEFGVAFHEAMEVYYDPTTWEMPRLGVSQLAIKTFVDKCTAQRKAALAAKGVPMLEDDVQADYDERVELGKGMLQYYFNKVAPKLDIGWKPVKVEVPFMVPIKHPETGADVIWCKCNLCYDKYVKWCNKEDGIAVFRQDWIGLPVVYAGRIDMLAEDHHGRLWIFDWKTCRSIADKYEFLYLDDQVGGYPWALWKLGLDVRGFVYHEQRKGFPQPPAENKQRRLGCLYSVNKMQDTDYQTYLETVQQNDEDAYNAGKYDKMLDFLKNEGVTYYNRHQVHKSLYEMQQFEHNLGLTALEMIRDNLPIYPSPGRFGCSFCAFREPCMGMNSGEDYEYYLSTMFEQREHYYVRAEPSTESKGGE